MLLTRQILQWCVWCRYVDYLLDAVGKRDLFSLLRLEPERFWHSLLFRDRYNYLGILAHIPPQLQESLTQHPGALTQVHNSLLLFWLATHLFYSAAQNDMPQHYFNTYLHASASL